MRSRDFQRRTSTAPRANASAGPAFVRPAVRNILHPHIQRQLSVSAPGDASEVEADRVAREVMRMPEGTVQRMCTDCEEEKETPVS